MMTKMTRGLWLVAALAFAGGCGEPGGADGGTGCTTDANCGTGKACHPVMKMCVATCTGATDCPASAKTCATLNGSTAQFCQCSTNELCAAGVAGNVCSAATKQCTAKCTSSANCPSGSTCDTATGVCGAVSSMMDAGTMGMDAGTACNDVGVCVYPEVCDIAARVCKAGAACTMANAQPDVCGYAGYCTTNSNCAQVEKAMCENFAATGPTPAVFNAATSNGPVIIGVTADPNPPAANCFKGYFVHSMVIDAYRTDMNWPAQLSALSGAFYVTTAGAKQDLTAGLPGSYYTPTAKRLSLRKYLCAKTSTSFNAGFVFTGGNEACFATSGAVAGTTSCTSNADCGSGSTCTIATGVCN
jgi:hypothetical protein